MYRPYLFQVSRGPRPLDSSEFEGKYVVDATFGCKTETVVLNLNGVLVKVPVPAVAGADQQSLSSERIPELVVQAVA